MSDPSRPTTAVTGATGALGSAVATALGPLVDRLVVRTPSRVPVDHADTEEAIRASGTAWTFLRDNFHAEVLPYFADDQG